MGQIDINPPPRKLIVGTLFSDADNYAMALRRIEMDFGKIDAKSDAIPFDMTDYYSEEMGGSIQRQWLSIESLVKPHELAKIKVHTNRMEEWLAGLLEAGNRRRAVNLDPGLLDLSKLILASAKDFSHRIYLREGIYAEVTLRWRKKTGYEAAGDWTYRDYLTPTALGFFRRVRGIYKEQLKSCP